MLVTILPATNILVAYKTAIDLDHVDSLSVTAYVIQLIVQIRGRGTKAGQYGQ